MSNSSSIDFEIQKHGSFRLCIKDIIELFLNQGWRMRNNGRITYLPKGNDAFNWMNQDIPEDELYEIIKQKEASKETVGIVLYWSDSNVGIDLLLFNVMNFSILPNINRVYNNYEACSITDFNWYLDKIIPCLCTHGLFICDIKMNHSWVG